MATTETVYDKAAKAITEQIKRNRGYDPDATQQTELNGKPHTYSLWHDSTDDARKMVLAIRTAGIDFRLQRKINLESVEFTDPLDIAAAALANAIISNFMAFRRDPTRHLMDRR